MNNRLRLHRKVRSITISTYCPRLSSRCHKFGPTSFLTLCRQDVSRNCHSPRPQFSSRRTVQDPYRCLLQGRGFDLWKGSSSVWNGNESSLVYRIGRRDFQVVRRLWKVLRTVDNTSDPVVIISVSLTLGPHPGRNSVSLFPRRLTNTSQGQTSSPRLSQIL